MSRYERKLRRAARRKKRMVRDVTVKVLGFDMKPIPVPKSDDEDEHDLKLWEALCNALMASKKDDETAGAVKLKRFELARKLHACEGEFKFSTDDLDMCRKMVADVYTTSVSGSVWEMLAEESEAVKTDAKPTAASPTEPPSAK